MKSLEVRLSRVPGRERVVGQLAEAILDEVAAAAARWRVHARETGVSTKSAKAIEKAIGECLARV